MSGGVGPCGDIKLPSEGVPASPSAVKAAIKPVPRSRFLTFRQLNALAVMIVFAASGMVAVEDLAFSLFALFYIFFLSRAAFPSSPSPDPKVFGEKSRLLGLYMGAAALVGLLLPVVYIFEGLLEGDKEGVKAAAPHVFLLSAQVFLEGVTFSGRFSIPIRVFVPVFFNTRRLFTLSEWLRAEIGKATAAAEHGSDMRLRVGRGLAVANMAFWAFNLLGFLLPVYLPRALKMYYSKIKD